VLRETRAVLFDAAGTLFDVEPDLATRLVAALDGLVTDPDAAVRDALSRVNSRGGWPEDQPDRPSRLAVWTEFVQSILDDTGADALDGEARSIAADIVDPRSYRLFPETLAVLEHLAAQAVPCAIVSNFDGLLLEILDHLAIRDHFVTVAYSGDVGVYKPDPRIFARALAPLETTAEYAVMVGDSPYSDIGGATAFGLRAILVDRENQRPDHEGEVVTSLAELPSLLLGASA
jgi:HAD superfamily hydrolase (TIGR01509 family)